MAKHVYEVKSIEVSALQGVRYNLHCGTSLWKDECVKVDKNTPLFT